MSATASPAAPSRQFLVQQACLTVLAEDAGFLAKIPHGLSLYTKGRFDCALRGNRYTGVEDLIASIRREYRALASKYGAN